MAEVNLEIPVSGKGACEMAEGCANAESNVMQTIMTGMAADAAGAASRRTTRADQLAADSAAMWGIAMTSPTILAGMGLRVAQQSEGYPSNSGGTGTGGTKP